MPNRRPKSLSKPKPKPKKTNGLLWVIEPLENETAYHRKAMFGCEACYLDGRMVLVLADSKEPWSGVLIPTEREHHEKLIKDFPMLEPHPILPKWLYLSQRDSDFEATTQILVERARKRDPLIGIEPGKKKKPRRSKRAVK